MKPINANVSLLFALLSSSLAGCASMKKPNIILIMADDVGTGDIPGYWGNENEGVVDMPNIFKLSKKGTLFTDFHSTPLCATSRYVLLSGNYQHRGRSAGGTWRMGQKSQFVRNQKSIAEVLRDEAGYDTAIMGKWHLGGRIPSPDGRAWSERHILTHPAHNWTRPLVDGPQTLGFDSSLITDKGIQGAPYSFFRNGFLLTDMEDVRYWNRGLYAMPRGLSEIDEGGEGGKDWDTTAYNMVLLNETNRFLDDHFNNRPDVPFFAYVALGEAHLPHSPPDAFLDGSRVAGETPTNFLDMLKEMDLVVGSLLQSIEDRGIADDTIIIFTTDNGGLPSSQTSNSEKYGHRTGGPLLRGSKGTVFEGGHRVPFIARYDGVFPAGEERSHLVGMNDVFATLCEIAGIDVPSGSAVDSISFADYIVSNDGSELRKFLGTWNDPREVLGKAIRYENYKLVYEHVSGPPALYDLEVDVGETTDLLSDPDKQDMIRTMQNELDRLRPQDVDEKAIIDRLTAAAS